MYCPWISPLPPPPSPLTKLKGFWIAKIRPHIHTLQFTSDSMPSVKRLTRSRSHITALVSEAAAEF